MEPIEFTKPYAPQWGTSGLHDPSRVPAVASMAIDQENHWGPHFPPDQRTQLVASLQGGNPVTQLRALRVIEADAVGQVLTLWKRIEHMVPDDIRDLARYAHAYWVDWAEFFSTELEYEAIRATLRQSSQNEQRDALRVILQHRASFQAAQPQPIGA